jgi:hypothetical protein
LSAAGVDEQDGQDFKVPQALVAYGAVNFQLEQSQAGMLAVLF